MSPKIEKSTTSARNTNYPAPVEGKDYTLPQGSSVGFEKLSLAVYGTRKLARALELANPGSAEGPRHKIKGSVKTLKIPTREEAEKLLEAPVRQPFSPQPGPVLKEFKPQADLPASLTDFQTASDFSPASVALESPQRRYLPTRQPEKLSLREASTEVAPRRKWNDHLSAEKQANEVYHAFDGLSRNAKLLGAATGATLGFVAGASTVLSAGSALLAGTGGVGTVASLYYAPLVLTAGTVAGGLVGGAVGAVAVEAVARVAQGAAYATFGLKNMMEDALQAIDDLAHPAFLQGG